MTQQETLATELLQLYPRQLTVAMALEAAEKIIAEQKKNEDQAFTTRFFAKSNHAPNPIKQLNNSSK